MMKKVVGLLLVGLMLLRPWSVAAQTEPITEKQSILNEIAEVERTYKGQLAEYRQAASQFEIAKGQFEKLNTLASLEVAVQDTRKVMLLRDQVFLTYLKLIELNLLEAEGINLEEKTVALEKTRELQLDFTAHFDLVDRALDRVGVGQAADDFEVLSPQIVSLSNYVSTLLKISKLQTVYDHALSIVDKTNPQIVDGEVSVEQNERIRAHQEVVNLMQDILVSLQTGWDQIRKGRLEGKPSDISKLNASIFSNLSQVMRFLEEIVIKQ